MRNAKFLTLVFVTAVASLAPAAAFAQVTADDFIPVAQGGRKGIEKPELVAVSGTTVTAATGQDAINAAEKKNIEALAAGGTEEMGARMVKFPSGLGFVATGVGTYRSMENPTATRIDKRHAYVVAFSKAKKGLAETLGGLTNEGKESVREALVNINLPKEEMTNIETQNEESLKQIVEMMLRGFVIYEVKDDTTQHTVYVTIVTTPKTRGRFARRAPTAIDANDLRDGLNQVIAEVRAGLVPPIGGRTITMRTTGETAFVGFGSSVVRTSGNNAVQLKLNLEAQKIAAARAKDALCGVIIGDKTYWEGKVDEATKNQVKEFESLDANDPLARKDPANVRKFDEARQAFHARLESTEEYHGLRSGKLPPGINTRTWFDEDHAWAYGISVYIPSLTNTAAKSGREMLDSTILQSIDDGSKTKASSGFLDENQPEATRPGKKVKPGPTGKIEPE